MWKFIRRFLAWSRLNDRAICEESRGDVDYHDWPDESEIAGPIHGYTYHCERCGKAFTI
jgi:hypothetical protein